MNGGLGHVQRRVLEALAQAGEPLWFRDLLRAVWGPAPTASQVETTRQAVHALHRRALLHHGHAVWNNAAEQQARHRLKVWLPDHPAPSLRPRLHRAEVQAIILEVLAAPPDMPVFTRREARYRQGLGAAWWPYHQFFRAVSHRVAALPGAHLMEAATRAGAIHRARQRLERQRRIMLLRKEGHVLFIRTR